MTRNVTYQRNNLSYSCPGRFFPSLYFFRVNTELKDLESIFMLVQKMPTYYSQILTIQHYIVPGKTFTVATLRNPKTQLTAIKYSLRRT